MALKDPVADTVFSQLSVSACVFCPAGLLGVPERWAPPVREGEPVCGSAPVGAAGKSLGPSALHAALLGGRGPQEPSVQSPLWPVMIGGGRGMFEDLL